VLTRAILVEAQRAYGVNPRRIYAMGHSSGASFAEFIAVLLRDRIAAFSENSGGLVRCGRTPGCAFQGSGTSCSALRTQSGSCNGAGAELPVAVPTTGRMPPGLLTHGTRDPLVSVYYTFSMADLMTARGHTQVTPLLDGDGHAIPPNWAQLTWPFFAARLLGDP
jgi:predicted esterase